jgi:hypothetical protein
MIPSSPPLVPLRIVYFLASKIHTHTTLVIYTQGPALTILLRYYYNIERNKCVEKPFFSDFCFSTFYTMFACLDTKRWTRNYVVEMKTNSVDERVRILL